MIEPLSYEFAILHGFPIEWAMIEEQLLQPYSRKLRYDLFQQRERSGRPSMH